MTTDGKRSQTDVRIGNVGHYKILTSALPFVTLYSPASDLDIATLVCRNSSLTYHPWERRRRLRGREQVHVLMSWKFPRYGSTDGSTLQSMNIMCSARFEVRQSEYTRDAERASNASSFGSTETSTMKYDWISAGWLIIKSLDTCWQRLWLRATSIDNSVSLSHHLKSARWASVKKTRVICRWAHRRRTLICC